MKALVVSPLLAAAAFGLLAAAAAPLAHSAPPVKEPKRGEFTIVNKTEWTIQGILITAAEEDEWSANLIKGKPLAKGATVKLKVLCEESDVRLLDVNGKTCTSESMYPCERHATWTLTPQELAGCKGFGR